MRAALVFTRNASDQRFELLGGSVTIGRGAECELQLADHRVSTRHCRLYERDDHWLIEDLKSTNRTFVNGKLLDGQPHLLRHGDIVRLGARDAQLFEAQFVLHERTDAHRAAAREVTEGVHRQLTELQAQLATRNDEINRLGTMIKRLQAQLADGEAAAIAVRRASKMMTGEIEELRSQLAIERTEHAACRDQAERARQRCGELEAQLEAQARKVRRDSDDGERSRSELESRLRLANSELATTKTALAVATNNVCNLQQAYDDALLRLKVLEDPTSAP
jgi:predicted  nucleic acid-binding Zn-ribbon protein